MSIESQSYQVYQVKRNSEALARFLGMQVSMTLIHADASLSVSVGRDGDGGKFMVCSTRDVTLYVGSHLPEEFELCDESWDAQSLFLVDSVESILADPRFLSEARDMKTHMVIWAGVDVEDEVFMAVRGLSHGRDILVRLNEPDPWPCRLAAPLCPITCLEDSDLTRIRVSYKPELNPSDISVVDAALLVQPVSVIKHNMSGRPLADWSK